MDPAELTGPECSFSGGTKPSDPTPFPKVLNPASSTSNTASRKTSAPQGCTWERSSHELPGAAGLRSHLLVACSVWRELPHRHANTRERRLRRVPLDLSCTKLSENYVAVTHLLDTAGIPYWKGGNAGYFLWVDLSAYLLPKEYEGDDAEREGELAGRILRGGVWLNPGQERGRSRGGLG